ncbi:hypothetical protein E3N88_25509 [Mikania micrantha]|uniref:Retroviral polymerase SH3-like domain-containing protein n=1 Tax=Mikania micrantha TaxID=192012 RepID=A0A5N6N7R0_9ASTR|nr:hypothetical protein E3N88_25509 [Mikania micrantha]
MGKGIHSKTAYEVLYKIKPLISFFRVFGCPCFILNTNDSLSKFAAKVDCGYFVGYSQTSKAYRAFNLRKNIVEETIDVKFNEFSSAFFSAIPEDMFDLDNLTYLPPVSSLPTTSESCQTSEDLSSIDDFSGSPLPFHITPHLRNISNHVEQVSTSSTPIVKHTSSPPMREPSSLPAASPSQTENLPLSNATSTSNCLEIIPYDKNHPLEQILGDLNKCVQTRSHIASFCLRVVFLSQIESSKYQEDLKDINWVEAMQEALQKKCHIVAQTLSGI